MLSDDLIRRAKPGVKVRRLSDEKGLSLLLTPRGARLWRFRYTFPLNTRGSRENMISLGRYPEVSLAQARERRDAARRDVANNVNPSLRRTVEKICRGNAFEAVAREFIGILRATNISPERPTTAAAELIQQALSSSRGRRPRRREPIAAETIDMMERRLELHVFPHVGMRDIQVISAPELLAVLRRIEARGTYDLAHRVRSICSRVFRFARATGRGCNDVAADLIGALTPVVSEHMAAIVEPDRIGALLRSIDAYRGQPLTQLALKLVPYIFPRPIEFRSMEWQHVQLHGPSPQWRVPWRRMKMREPHIVPLSRQAVEILREVHRLAGEGRWVFPQTRNPNRPMSECCITGALRAMGYGGAEMTWHGFRALASSQLHELGWNDRWIETQLAHGDRNRVRAAYNHAKYLPQRRTMMQAWADYLDSLRAEREIAVSHEAGQQAAITAMDAFQCVNAEQMVSLQSQAMAALRAIISMSSKR